MVDKCGKCEKVFIGGDVVAKCVDCKLSFHAACTRAGSTRSFSKSGNKTLKCDSCAEESKSTTSTRSNEGNEDKKSILEAIQSLKADINKIDEKVTSVLSSVASLQEDTRKLHESFVKLEGEQNKLQERCNRLEQANEELTGEVRDLQLRVNDAEQHSRASNVEIVGFPTTENENVFNCLQHVASALGISFRPEDFSVAHRLRTFSSRRHSHPPIIAQFVSRGTKDAWMKAVREKKHLNASDIHPSLPSSTIYVNDHLTPHNKALLGKARRLRREKKIAFAGYFHGKVIIKAAEGAEGVRVNKLDELDKFDRK